MALVWAGVSSEGGRFIATTSGTKVTIAEETDREKREVRVVTLNAVDTLAGCSAADGECVVAMTIGGKMQRPLLAVCTSEKHLVLWECGQEEWRKKGERMVAKRVTGLQISEDGEYLLTADKTGSIIRYGVSDLVSDKGEEIMGHLSMILDMVMVSHDSHVITCDRDEKIRVSRYPNCYHIETFCLGHSEFVSSVCLCKKWPHLLISTSGDGTVRSWDWKKGLLLDTHNFSSSSSSSSCSSSSFSSSSSPGSQGKESVTVTGAVCSQFMEPPLIAASLEGMTGVSIIQLSSDGRLHQLTLEIPLPVSPWSCVFDWSDRLWVCLPHEPDPVQCWSLTDGKFERCHTDPLQQKLSHWNHFRDCREWRDWESMRKNTTCDNMADYLARKEERIRQRTTTKSGAVAIAEEEEEATLLSQPPAEKRTKTTNLI